MIQLLMAEGQPFVIPGNSGILTSGSSFTLPSTSGTKIKVLAIAGGAGGGGGSARGPYYSGFDTGGGGGGAGGNAYVANVAVTPGQTINFSIGSAGGAGSARDGIYTAGSNGGNGGVTYITVNSTTVAYATGGVGGLVSPNASGGSAGGETTGSPLITPVAGGSASGGTQNGGYGANGYAINTTVGSGTILTYGNIGTASTGFGSGPSQTGTIYGAGGGGGGTCQSDQGGQQNGAQNAASGSGGAVFIWWGY